MTPRWSLYKKIASSTRDLSCCGSDITENLSYETALDHQPQQPIGKVKRLASFLEVILEGTMR
jgi:hypothetical protein